MLTNACYIKLEFLHIFSKGISDVKDRAQGTSHNIASVVMPTLESLLVGLVPWLRHRCDGELTFVNKNLKVYDGGFPNEMEASSYGTIWEVFGPSATGFEAVYAFK